MTRLDAQRAEALRRAWVRWGAAEDRLFPIALVDPDAYRRALSLVSVLLEELRAGTTTLDQLLALDLDPQPLLQACGAQGADRLVLEAAFAVRGRELAAAAQRHQKAMAIASARCAGASWVDLEGSWDAVCRTGTRHTEMHLASGQALVATVEPHSGDGPYRLEVLMLNGDTGTPVERTDRDRAFADRAQWLVQRERWRAEIEVP